MHRKLPLPLNLQVGPRSLLIHFPGMRMRARAANHSGHGASLRLGIHEQTDGQIGCEYAVKEGT